jgi:simple sugar transport system permease protein
MKLRIARRKTIPARQVWCIRLIGLATALLVGAVIIIALGHNPLAVYSEMVRSVFGGRIGFNQTVRIFVPLLGAALAVGLAFKMRFWNIGAEGQILIGGIAASYFALFHHGNMPRLLLLIVMGLAAATAGGLWGFIPAFFRAKWGTNETLFTLMLNYVALGIIIYLQSVQAWRREGEMHPIIAMFPAAARLPQIGGVHIGWVMVLILTGLVYFYLAKSKQGYQLSVVGESENTARYAGMNVKNIIIRTMFLSGAIAGLAGFWQVSGADFTLNETTANGVGFTAIIVAWLARLNPLAMVLVAAFIAILERGSIRIQTVFSIPSMIASVLIGIILFAMLACEFFVQYRLQISKGEAA